MNTHNNTIDYEFMVKLDIELVDFVLFVSLFIVTVSEF